MDLYHLMETALEEAKKAMAEGEVPVGAVLARADGSIISRDHNRPIGLKDPTAHAEVLVLRKAARRLGNYRLTGTTLVVTIEPCLMCFGAALHARVEHLVFGAKEPKGGAVGSVFNLASFEKLNHKIKITSGILEQQCGKLLQNFFRQKRQVK